MRAIVLLIVVLVSTVTTLAAPAPPGKSEARKVELAGNTVTVQVPKHELVTVEEKAGWLFYSVSAGYEDTGTGPYASVPAEMTVSLAEGTLDGVLASHRKTYITADRELVRELKREGQVIWLTKDKGDAEGMQTLRAFHFAPASDAVLIIDASMTRVKGMPAKNQKVIAELLMTGLKSVKLGEKAVKTPEAQRHVSGGR